MNLGKLLLYGLGAALLYELVRTHAPLASTEPAATAALPAPGQGSAAPAGPADGGEAAAPPAAASAPGSAPPSATVIAFPNLGRQRRPSYSIPTTGPLPASALPTE